MHVLTRFWKGTLAAACGAVALAQTPSLYENRFEQAELGKVPDGMLVLDGAFAVREEGGNRFLELPGAPLETFSVLFGPAARDGQSVAARIFGTARGRRYPTFAVSLNGLAGYRLQVSPGKQHVELYKGDEVKLSRAYAWRPGQWTHFRLQVRQEEPDRWKVEGRVWAEGTAEPDHWTLAWVEPDEPRSGRPGIFGSPYAGTPIRYDDLVVSKVPVP
ncbi:MAG: hypothetical protein FJ387_18395 [Verrucomicrobia bacterium]|nr:hypothetical protein [Verrucomicrobiota bacterium]